MTNFTRRMATPFARALSISGVLGATLLGATSLSAPAFAQGTTMAPAAADTSEAKAESIEQRITSLHDMLKITAGQETLWTPVAQTMRDNSAEMEKMVADKKAQSPASMTALDDMTNYQAFAQARVDGSKKLSAVFTTLYNAMPDSQKAVADDTFRNFGRSNAKRG
jgi:periplasmic protein CpxP/Spy